MIEAIGGVMGSLKAAQDLLGAFHGTKTEVEVIDAKLTLQRHLLEAYAGMLTAQQEILTLTQRNDALEAEIGRLKDWSREADNYELADAGRGALAYRAKAAVADAQPMHWLCPACYQAGKKAILQPEDRGAYHVLKCHPCSLELTTLGRRVDRNAR